MEWFVVSILKEPISNGTPDFRLWPLGELNVAQMIACFSSAIRLEAELGLPDPLTSETDPMYGLLLPSHLG